MAKVGKPADQLPAEVKPQSALMEARPAYLSEIAPEDMHGIAEVSKFIVPPRLKTIQKSAAAALLSEFNVGDIIAMPSKQLVAAAAVNDKGKPTNEPGKPFFMTPIFFFPEWIQWNPIEYKGAGPIRIRTTDPRHPIALKAQNPATWFEPCPELQTKSMRNVEHLNFICILHDKPDFDMPVVMSFSRGEHGVGSGLCGLIRTGKAPLYSRVFQCTPMYRPDKGKGDWCGFDVTPPDGDANRSSWITDQQLFQQYKELHLMLKEKHSAGLIDVDHQDPTEGGAPVSSEY